MRNRICSFFLALVFVILCGCSPELQDLDDSLVVTDNNSQETILIQSNEPLDSLTTK